MAALLRQGARRIGGSVLQRTQAAVTSPAVAEERRRLVPRRFSTDAEEIQQKKEELYVALSKAENWRDMRLLQDLAAHVKPRAQDSQWRRLRASRWFTNVVTAAGTVSCTCMVVVGLGGGESYVEEKKKVFLRLMKREKEQGQGQEQEQEQ